MNLVYIDQGNYIPESICEKIFHLFFTTKPISQCTGLGLSLTVESNKSHGTTFTIQLPNPKNS